MANAWRSNTWIGLHNSTNTRLQRVRSWRIWPQIEAFSRALFLVLWATSSCDWIEEILNVTWKSIRCVRLQWLFPFRARYPTNTPQSVWDLEFEYWKWLDEELEKWLGLSFVVRNFLQSFWSEEYGRFQCVVNSGIFVQIHDRGIVFRGADDCCLVLQGYCGFSVVLMPHVYE